MELLWMNVDRPNRKCTIHKDCDCLYVDRKAETAFKGIKKLKRDGGWLPFERISDAKAFQEENFEQFTIGKHC